MTHTYGSCLILLAAALMPRVAASAEPEDAAALAWIQEQVGLLGSDNLKEREDASLQIAMDDRASLAMIERALLGDAGGGGMSLEARERLTRAAAGMFGAEPRGALGVSFARFDASEGVEIGGTVEGFAAKSLLQVGDVVRSMDGVSVRFNNEARAVILSHDPGESVAIELVRRGEVMTVMVPLGSFQNLRNAAEPENQVLGTAWEMRCARRAGQGDFAMPRVLEPGLDRGRWIELLRSERRREGVSVVRGNIPRNWADQNKPVETASALGGGEARGVPENYDPEFGMRQLADENPKVRGLMAQIDDLTRRIANGESRLRDGKLNAEQKKRLMEQLGRERVVRDNFAQQLRGLTQVRDEVEIPK